MIREVRVYFSSVIEQGVTVEIDDEDFTVEDNGEPIVDETSLRDAAIDEAYEQLQNLPIVPGIDLTGGEDWNFEDATLEN